MSKTVVLELADGAFSMFPNGPGELMRELRRAAAMKVRNQQTLSNEGRRIRRLKPYDFIHALARFRVSPIQERPEELAEGLARARSIGH
ncbi:MAG: UPF0175 family protein [Verrucomicrobia bacterium]|nr:UPF0175 family protein [Verrucomicrobiota bacterium]